MLASRVKRRLKARCLMPQLDFSVFPSQLFWLVICFMTMLFIMSRFIIPKTAEMINLRRAKIDADLEQAEEIKKHVEETLEKYKKSLAEATAKANISLQKTRDELNETVARKQEEISLRMKSEMEENEKKIDEAKDRAMKKVEEAAADLAIDVLEKLGFSGIKAKDAKNALDLVKREQL